jgi:hypothetical protein
MKHTFLEKLKKNGHSLKYFYDTYMAGKTDKSYQTVYQQINGYTKSGISEEVQDALKKYINEK